MRFQRNVTLLLDEWRLVVTELDAGAEVDGGAWSSMMPQQSVEHCATLGEHLLDGLGEHLHNGLGSTCRRPRAPLASKRVGAKHPWFFFGRARPQFD